MEEYSNLPVWVIGLAVFAALGTFGLGGWINSLIQAWLATKREERELERAKQLRLRDERRAAYAHVLGVTGGFSYKVSQRVFHMSGGNLSAETDMLVEVSTAIARAELVAGVNVRQQLRAIESQVVAVINGWGAVKEEIDEPHEHSATGEHASWPKLEGNIKKLLVSRHKLLEGAKKELGVEE